LLACSVDDLADAPAEIYVGWPTVKAILANKVVPGLLDRYLAWNNAGQLSQEAEDPQRPDNLFTAMPGRHGAHGRFDQEARAHSLELRASTRRGWLCARLGLEAGAALGWLTSGGAKAALPRGLGQALSGGGGSPQLQACCEDQRRANDDA
jgi:hypothetical protein